MVLQCTQIQKKVFQQELGNNMIKQHTQTGQTDMAAGMDRSEPEQTKQTGKPQAEGDSASAQTKEQAQDSQESSQSEADQTAGAEAAASSGANEPTPEEKIAELEAKCADLNDQYLRKAADFENFRKRMMQEKQNAIDFANQSLLLDIVPVIDDFERAITAAQNSTDYAALLDGITMIEKRLTSQLESKWGLKRFDSKGEPFDPNRHEALMMEKSPEVTEPVVQEDLIKGYLLKERVIRAAKVKVVMPE
jgi:molecular chaperone GrpE